jgi:hypothetical protein
LSHVARKFERLLETYRRGNGGRWSGIELERATGGVVTRSYVTNLRKGRGSTPGYGQARCDRQGHRYSASYVHKKRYTVYDT